MNVINEAKGNTSGNKAEKRSENENKRKTMKTSRNENNGKMLHGNITSNKITGVTNPTTPTVRGGWQSVEGDARKL
jgi:hypothetical protein